MFKTLWICWKDLNAIAIFSDPKATYNVSTFGVFMLLTHFTFLVKKYSQYSQFLWSFLLQTEVTNSHFSNYWTIYIIYCKNTENQSNKSIQFLWKRGKQPLEVFCKKRCSWKFRRIYKKTPALESLFNKIEGLRPVTSLKKRFGHR